MFTIAHINNVDLSLFGQLHDFNASPDQSSSSFHRTQSAVANAERYDLRTRCDSVLVWLVWEVRRRNGSDVCSMTG